MTTPAAHIHDAIQTLEATSAVWRDLIASLVRLERHSKDLERVETRVVDEVCSVFGGAGGQAHGRPNTCSSDGGFPWDAFDWVVNRGKEAKVDRAALGELRALLDKHRRERLYGDVRDARGDVYMPDSAEAKIARRALMETDAEVIDRLVSMSESGADAKDIASRVRKELAPVLGIDEQAMPADAMAELAAERLNARLPEHARGSVAPGTTPTERLVCQPHDWNHSDLIGDWVRCRKCGMDATINVPR